MTKKISISINLTKKRIVAIVLAVYFCLLGASYFGLHRAQDDWQIAYLRWDQATLISGEIVETNDSLADTPENVNSDAFGSWMFKIKAVNPADVEGLLTAEQYEAENA